MTGNFKIIVVQNKTATQYKWLIHQDNITEKSLINLSPYYLTEPSYISQMGIKALFDTKHPYDALPTEKAPSDEYRNLTLSEYLTLGIKLRDIKMKYNKKKDILITNIIKK